MPCDPAQVIVNHASFRVELGSPAPVSSALLDTAPITRVRNRRPVVWSGRAAPGDPGAGSLLQAVRDAGGGPNGVATQVLPRITDTAVMPPVPAVVGPRDPEPAERGRLIGDPRDEELATAAEPRPAPQPHRPDARQGYYPGRRLSLGIVLLPLRLLLGFITITAGFAKLTDPVYFDGGERGSMVNWLSSLEPWSLASPLHEWALAHPVGAGLTVAFTQIVVGVLTMAGLWQRLAAIVGALLSLALLVTVSWQTGPAYDAPDIILLAAWSPLIIAGAPVYSLDGRLSSEAWRTLGPRVQVNDLRRRVLRRGALWAMLLLGVTLLLGSLLGGAVRSAELTTVPRPGDPPRNSQPGTAVPGDEEEAGEDEEEDLPLNGEEPSGAATEGTPQDAEGQPEDSAPDGGAPTEQTVPDSGQPTQEAPSSQPEQQPQSSGDAPPPPPAAENGSSGGGDGGTSEEPSAPEPDPVDEGGEGSSLGPIGGLLG